MGVELLGVKRLIVSGAAVDVVIATGARSVFGALAAAGSD